MGIHAPSHLSKAAKAFWRQIQHEYSVTDGAGLRILANACECMDRAEAARAQINREGLTVKNRMGTSVVNPLCNVERDARSGMLQSLKALNLDIEPLRDGPGRPGNRR